MLQALEAAAFAAPSDVGAFRAWADALEAEGDPLGESLSLSFEQTAAPDPALRERLSLLRRHLEAGGQAA